MDGIPETETHVAHSRYASMRSASNYVDQEYASNEEAQLYSSLVPSLLKSISAHVRLGLLPSICTGTVLLARIESRILMLRCTERSFEGHSFSIMGAELQPTSCHALEGTEVDSVLDQILDHPDRGFQWINPHIFHSLKVFTHML